MWVCTIFSFNAVKETGRNQNNGKKNPEDYTGILTNFLKGFYTNKNFK